VDGCSLRVRVHIQMSCAVAFILSVVCVQCPVGLFYVVPLCAFQVSCCDIF
jgi:hypothetical protein